MSAECSKCGHDLDYYGGCAVCKQRSRAEAAERDNRRLREALRWISDWDDESAEFLDDVEVELKAIARKALAALPKGATREEQT